MLIKTMKELDALCKKIKNAKEIVADTETTGLHIFQGAKIIGISIYLPESDTKAYIPVRHGEGDVQVITSPATKGKEFSELGSSTRAWQTMFLGHLWSEYKPSDFGNLPTEAALAKLRAVWGLPHATYYFHNAAFDLHVLHLDGFPTPVKVEDTYHTLHTVFTEWQSASFLAPTKLKNAWQRDANGELVWSEQWGNRQLKWQAARIGLDGATQGEESLHEAIAVLRTDLTDTAVWDLTARSPHEVLTDEWFSWMAPQGQNADKRLVKLEEKLIDPAERTAFYTDKLAPKIHIDDKAHMWMLPASAVAEYAVLDCVLTWGLWKWCEEELELWKSRELNELIQNVMLHVTWPMERNGFKLDVQKAIELQAMYRERMNDIATLLGFHHDQLDGEFDQDDSEYEASPYPINSNKSLLDLLNNCIGFEVDVVLPDWVQPQTLADLKIYPHVKLTGTSKEQLDTVADHLVVRLVRLYRQYQKSATTYLGKWISAADENGIVHGSINPTGTGTGRCSSSGDAGNLQNIPQAKGYDIKTVIVPYDPSYVLWGIDYSQLELRLAAWVAEGILGLDPNMAMTRLIEDYDDPHSYVRDMLNIRRIMWGDMTDEQIVAQLGYASTHPDVATPQQRAKLIAKTARGIAKTANFGLLYSGTYKMLSKMLRIGYKPAEEIVQGWQGMFPAFPRAQQYYTDEALRLQAHPDGLRVAQYVRQPIHGRYRKTYLLPTWRSIVKDGRTQGYNPREAAARTSWNWIVQGTGGTICVHSAYDYTMQAKKRGVPEGAVKMFAQIHDALDGYVKVDHMTEIKQLAGVMVDWPMINPGLQVVIQGSPSGNWQDMQDVVDFDLWVDSKGRHGY
jgi:DNA polymerase I-like protein with 3'-5' exonuclease and polymerase domains